MKPQREVLARQLDGVDEPFIDAHLARLGEEYYAEFSLPEVVAHIREISRLDRARPLAVTLASAAAETGSVAAGAGDAEALSCTILAADHPGMFSLITGVLGAWGFAIDSGTAFTYGSESNSVAAGPRAAAGGAARVARRAPSRAAADRLRRRARSRTLRPAPQPRRMIVDRFHGRRVSAEASALSVEAWRQQLEQRLLQVAGDLERNAPEAARRRVSEMVAETIRRHWPTSPALYPVQIAVANDMGADDGAVTRMRIVSQDTPLFLYSFSAALALRDVSIQRVRITTEAGRVEDVVDVVDRSGAPIADPTLLNQIKLSVLLTKQFAYFVGVAPDPYAALLRFEQLTEQILGLPEEGRLLDLLADPRIMGELALLLGTSDYLWEDFIRQQFETLLPMLEQEQRPQLQ